MEEEDEDEDVEQKTLNVEKRREVRSLFIHENFYRHKNGEYFYENVFKRTHT